MVFHGTTGEQLICDCEEDIPEGYVCSPRDVKYKVTLGPLPNAKKDEFLALAEQYKKGYDEGYTAGLAAKNQTKKPSKKTCTLSATEKPKETEEETEETGAEASPEVTLEQMDLTRDEAKQMLKDEGVKFKANTSYAALAAKVKDLLDDDKSK